MKNKTKLERASLTFGGEVRTIDAEQGIVRAYLTKWGTVDEYRSTFKQGAFKKTFEERGDKVRLLWDHDTLCGKVLEAREDEIGPYTQVQFNLETRAGQEAFAHVKAGDVDCFSFGFNTIKDQWVDGVREIQEVRCMEVGPVVFEANAAANITEIRATDFEETDKADELWKRGYRLTNSLEVTLDDIWWTLPFDEALTAAVDKALADYHAAYIAWVKEYIAYHTGTEQRGIPGKNDLAKAVIEFTGMDIKKTAAETSFTEKELRTLVRGRMLSDASRAKLAELPEAARVAHHEERAKAVETLCTELRNGGFSNAEKTRLTALLNIEERGTGTSEILATLKALQKSFC